MGLYANRLVNSSVLVHCQQDGSRHDRVCQKTGEPEELFQSQHGSCDIHTATAIKMSDEVSLGGDYLIRKSRTSYSTLSSTDPPPHQYLGFFFFKVQKLTVVAGYSKMFMGNGINREICFDATF